MTQQQQPKYLSIESIKSLAVSMVSIIASVLIALAVNEWNQGRNDRQNAQRALEKITTEIQSNLKKLQRAHDNNKVIVDNMENEFDGEFIPSIQIQQTAWQTAIATGAAVHINYDIQFKLSGLYALQEMHKNYTYELVQTMLKTNAAAIAINPEVKSVDDIPSNAFNDGIVFVVQLESALISTYQQTLKQIQNASL